VRSGLERQQQILTVLRDWIDRHGYPPTMRQIGTAVGLASTSSVAHHLNILQTQGLVRRTAGGHRVPVSRRRSGTPVPLLGTIAAGVPITATEHVEEQLTLPAEFAGRGPLFALRVKGDSMTDAGIDHGDVIVVRQQPTADDGDIVAALIDDEATVKVYRRLGRRVVLEPRNPAYPLIPADDATVLGKVICVLHFT
jgi:repressor LexA